MKIYRIIVLTSDHSLQLFFSTTSNNNNNKIIMKITLLYARGHPATIMTEIRTIVTKKL